MKTNTHSPDLIHKMNEIPSPNPANRQTLALVGWLALCFATSGTAVFVSTMRRKTKTLAAVSIVRRKLYLREEVTARAATGA